MRITISGPIGSGKTTVCKLLAQRLDLPFLVSGMVFRDMARQLDLSLEDFGRLAESDPKYDKMIDEEYVERASMTSDIILEGRLAAHMLTRADLEAFRVYLDAAPRTRANRVAEREGTDPEQVLPEMLERERSEATRYRAYYDIDLDDLSVYDIIIDTTDIEPEAVVDRIIREMEAKKRPSC
jgi:predicted cytidylate kinase